MRKPSSCLCTEQHPNTESKGSLTPEVPVAEPEADGSVVMDGLTRLAEFEELAGVRLDREALPDVDTVGGLVMATEGRIPDVGDEITVAGRTLRVEAKDGLRVAAVRLLPT